MGSDTRVQSSGNAAADDLEVHLRGLILACKGVDFDAPGCLPVLESLRPAAVHLAWADWERVRHAFSPGETVILVQLLTVMEREFHWPGGALSSVSPILQEFRRREPEIASLLCDWVVCRTMNDYLPFGNAQSRRDWIASRTPCLNLRAARHRMALEHRGGLSPSAERERKLHAYALAREAEQARQEYLAEKSGAATPGVPQRSALDRLRYVAFDTRHELAFFPKEWARVGHDDLRGLDPQCRAALARRLQTATAVSWSRLYKRLRQLDQTP